MSSIPSLTNKGLVNVGNTCYMNSILQCISNSIYFQKTLNSIRFVDNDTNNTSTVLLVQQLMFDLKNQSDRRSVLNPSELVSNISNILRKNHQFNVYQQQCCSEFFDYFLSILSEELSRNKTVNCFNEVVNGDDLINDIFGGARSCHTSCPKCTCVHSHPLELYLTITLEISGVTNISKALEKHCGVEELYLSDQWICNRCECIQKGLREMKVMKGPNVLALSLKRFNNNGNKIGTYIGFEISLKLKLCKQEGEESYDMYHLIGITSHTGGSIQNGHFISYTKNEDGSWSMKSDHEVRTISEEEVLKVQAYFLMYEKNTEAENLAISDQIRHKEEMTQERFRLRAAKVADQEKRNIEIEIALSTRKRQFEENLFSDVLVESRKAESRLQQELIEKTECVRLANIENQRISRNLKKKENRLAKTEEKKEETRVKVGAYQQGRREAMDEEERLRVRKANTEARTIERKAMDEEERLRVRNADLEARTIERKAMDEEERLRVRNADLEARTIERMAMDEEERLRVRNADLEARRIQRELMEEDEIRKVRNADLESRTIQRAEKQNKLTIAKAKRGYFENWMLETKLCNPYYEHSSFKESHNKYNWHKAIESSYRFGHRRSKGYKSLEFFWNVMCANCGATYLNDCSKAFSMKCCKDSLFDGVCPPLQPLIDEIGCFVMDSKSFCLNAHAYNNRLSFGATGVDNDKGGGYEKRGPVSSVTAMGRLYHFVGNQSSMNASSGLGAIFFDQPGKVAENGTGEISKHLETDILDKILQGLQEKNGIAIETICLREELEKIEGTIGNDENLENLQLSLSGSTEYLDIAVLTNDKASGNRVVRFMPKNGLGEYKKLDWGNCLMESYCYPLLFSRGERGWAKDLKLPMCDYISNRLLQCEFEKPSHLYPYHKSLMTNRFCAMAKLGSVWAVDCVSRMVDNKLNFVKKNQPLLFGGQERKESTDECFEDDNDDEYNSEKGTYCPKSVTGSPRHMKELACNALHAVSQSGPPSDFVTLTFNIKWREVQEKLLQDQTGFERADIIVQVFKSKLTAFLQNLRSGKYHNGTVVEKVVDGIVVGSEYRHWDLSGDKAIIYLMEVIEYQHRGLPHAHIVYRIGSARKASKEKETPEETKSRQDETIKYIDGFREKISENENIFHFGHVIASRPGKVVPKDGKELSADDEAQCIVDDLVGESQIHKCAIAINGCKRQECDTCKRGFDGFDILNASTFNEKGRPVYKRPTAADIKVVGYNEAMLLDWRGHMNVESASNSKCVLYLYDYLFKGLKKVLAEARKEALERGETGKVVDEIKLFIKGRLLCAMDATYRAFGFSNYPAQQPAVKLINVMLEDQVNFFLQKGKATDMLMYINRPQELQNLLFDQFFMEWQYKVKEPTSPNATYFEICFPRQNKRFYIVKWSKETSHLVRINMIYPNAGEVWYLRLILRHRAIRNFKEAYMFDGVLYPTFQQSAEASGLLSLECEALECFDEAYLNGDKTADKLRAIFCMLTLDGSNTLGILSNPEYVEVLTSDYTIHNSALSKKGTYILLLKDFKKRLQSHGKNLSDYGLDIDPETKEKIDLSMPTELEERLDSINVEKAKQALSQLNIEYPNNEEQSIFIDQVEKMLEDKTPQTKHRYICLHGQGGSGKSVVMSKVSMLVKTKGLLGLDCAQTNLAANTFENCLTAHNLLGYPVIEEGDSYDSEEKPDCRPGKERLELLLNAVLINWDEFFSAAVDHWEAAVRMLKNHPNLIWCFYGDSRQIAPIVLNGTAVDTILASVTSSSKWLEVETMFLIKNMRLEEMIATVGLTDEEVSEIDNQIKFALIQQSVGENRDTIEVCKIEEIETEYEITQHLALNNVKFFVNNESQIQQAIEWLYPNGKLPTRQEYSKGDQPSRVILATDNEKVDVWNERIQDLNPNKKELLISRDQFSDVDDTNGYLKAMLTTSISRDFTHTQVPEHELYLKIDDICLVTRNMTCLGLASNSTVRILDIKRFYILVVTMDKKNKTVMIPRIRFVFKLKYASSFSLTRIQFPLRLAYAMTINRSQGQSIDYLLLDVCKDTFQHGQTYVALSRIRKSDRLRLIVNEGDYFPTSFSMEPIPTPFIRNVIYPKLILNPP